LVSLGAVAAVNSFWPVSIIVVSIVSMVGLGLSIDYALLIVSRYRDGLDQGLSREEALMQAAKNGGRTVVLSGLTVAIGFSAMLLVRVSEVRSIGIGPWIDAVPLGLARKPDAGRQWRRWGNWVTRHPWSVLAAAGIPLLFLAAQAANLRIDLPRGRWLPESAQSVRVLHEIDSVARGNFGQIIQVVLYFPPAVAVQDETGWRAESRLVRFFARDARVQHVWAVTTLSPMPLAGPETLRRLPDSTRQSFVSADGRAAFIAILPRHGLAATDAAARASRSGVCPDSTSTMKVRSEARWAPWS
jgi:hypothetical protein